MKKKLPNDVAMRRTTTTEYPRGPLVVNGTGGGSTGVIQLSTSHSSHSSDEMEELLELAKDIKELKKQGSYVLGKKEAYINILRKFDECKSTPDIYKLIDEIRNELVKL